jgi:hypothetical protein
MEEDIIVPLIVFTFIFAMVALIMAQVRWSARHKMEAQGKEGTSLGTSELKALMREAVEEANEPLLARIEQLEHERVEAPRQLPAAEKRLDERMDESAPAPAKRRNVT